MVFKFDIHPIDINNRLIIHLPEWVSQPLPSRGMVMIQGTLNQLFLQVALEPDGNGSHWFEIPDHLKKQGSLSTDHLVSLSFEILNEWPAPELPQDLTTALTEENLLTEWQSLTPKAQWEWLRWIRGTNNPETREKRIQVTCSKLQKGNRRPCCFNASMCSITEVSKSGVLIGIHPDKKRNP